MRRHLFLTMIISAVASAITGLVMRNRYVCDRNRFVDGYYQLLDKYSGLLDEYTGTLEEYIQFMCDVYGIDPDDLEEEPLCEA